MDTNFEPSYSNLLDESFSEARGGKEARQERKANRQEARQERKATRQTARQDRKAVKTDTKAIKKVAKVERKNMKVAAKVERKAAKAEAKAVPQPVVEDAPEVAPDEVAMDTTSPEAAPDETVQDQPEVQAEEEQVTDDAAPEDSGFAGTGNGKILWMPTKVAVPVLIVVAAGLIYFGPKIAKSIKSVAA